MIAAALILGILSGLAAAGAAWAVGLEPWAWLAAYSAGGMAGVLAATVLGPLPPRPRRDLPGE
jgi:hypothetical protein